MRKPAFVTFVEILAMSMTGNLRQSQTVQRQKLSKLDNCVSSDEDRNDLSIEHAEEAAKFQISTCMSTSCAKKRTELGLDPLSTFASLYSRSKGRDGSLIVPVEESPCLGSCGKAPCVAVSHEDFVGYVSLEGMNEYEFSDRVFHSIISEADADRVWACVENAVKVMAEDTDS